MASNVANPRLGLVASGSVNGIEIYYERWGEGPPVLYFNGSGATLATMKVLLDVFAQRCDLLAHDQRGLGRTEIPPGPYAMADYAADAAGLLDHISWATCRVVGVSFGGMQAVHAVRSLPMPVQGLVLHSCAPSSLPYPDTAAQAWGAPVAFGRWTQRLTWAAVARSVRSEPGLKRMMAALSTRPIDEWWSTWPDDDRRRARALFLTMSSGTGFTLDLRQARADRGAYRRAMQQQVGCPTLVTASRHDGGVAFRHAQDLAATIPGSSLCELTAPSHLFWLGPEAPEARDAVASFLASITS